MRLLALYTFEEPVEKFVDTKGGTNRENAVADPEGFPCFH